MCHEYDVLRSEATQIYAQKRNLRRKFFLFTHHVVMQTFFFFFFQLTEEKIFLHLLFTFPIYIMLMLKELMRGHY